MTILPESALCDALDAIATWQQAGADTSEVPLPPHVRRAMESARASHEALRSLLDEVMRCTVSDGEYEIGAMLDDVDDIRGRVEFAIGRKLSP